MTNSDLRRYAVFKYIGLFVGVIFTFVQPRFFDRFFNQSDFAFLILIYGYASYFLFFDFGISKPIYSVLRKKYIVGESFGTILREAISFYNSIILLVTIIFVIFVALLSYLYPNTISPATLLFFGISVSLNIGLNYFENILEAINKQLVFQKIDLARKLINLSTLVFLFLEPTFTLSMILCSWSLLALLIFAVRKAYENSEGDVLYFPKSKEGFLNFAKTYWSQSFRYLVFSINETLIYNGGYILVPIFLSSFYVVQYGLWMKLYLAIVLAMRLVSNIFIHRISYHYFRSEFSKARRIYHICLFISVSLATASFLFVYVFNDLIFHYWVRGNYKFDHYLFYSLGVWSIFNSLQHTSGIFLMSCGNFFNYMRNVSTVILILMCVVSLYFVRHFSLEDWIMGTGIVYALGSLSYLYKAEKVLKGETC